MKVIVDIQESVIYTDDENESPLKSGVVTGRMYRQ